MKVKHRAEQISKVLFETDPMNTCCKENDCFDEYDHIAKMVEERLDEDQSLDEALIREISEWFFDGNDFDTARLVPILEKLGEGA